LLTLARWGGERVIKPNLLPLVEDVGNYKENDWIFLKWEIKDSKTYSLL
jgi:hypothetical protein